MNKKGQGALEYLLLIGGAILVAVVVITILSQVGSSSGSQTEINSVTAICASRPVSACGTQVIVGGTACECGKNDTNSGCEIDDTNAADGCP